LIVLSSGFSHARLGSESRLLPKRKEPKAKYPGYSCPGQFIKRRCEMEWYWWVLIGVVVVAGGYFKLKILGKIMENQKKKNQVFEDE
jgi:hypothetical protein